MHYFSSKCLIIRNFLRLFLGVYNRRLPHIGTWTRSFCDCSHLTISSRLTSFAVPSLSTDVAAQNSSSALRTSAARECNNIEQYQLHRPA